MKDTKTTVCSAYQIKLVVGFEPTCPSARLGGRASLTPSQHCGNHILSAGLKKLPEELASPVDLQCTCLESIYSIRILPPITALASYCCLNPVYCPANNCPFSTAGHRRRQFGWLVWFGVNFTSFLPSACALKVLTLRISARAIV
jgi:hypothetical protein